MGYAAELTEPTTGTEKHHPVQVEDEEDEQIIELERKTFRHGKGLDTSADNSTVTTNTSSSSSSFSGDQTVLEHLEQETETGFHEEHNDGDNCIVFFDEEHGSESAGAEPDVHESQTIEHLNGGKKLLGSENGSASENNKKSREIEEAQDDDVSKDLDSVIQPAGTVIEEEVDIEDVEYYDVENLVDKQETHELFCPNCKSCITRTVVLKRRKRKILQERRDPIKRVRVLLWNDPNFRSEDNLPSPDGGDNSACGSFFVKCLSCFTIFSPTGVSSKPLKTQPNPQEPATGNSNWFRSIFGYNQKGSAVQQVEPLPSVPEANPPRGDLAGSTVNMPPKAPALVQGDAATSDESENNASQDIMPLDTPSIQVTNEVDNNGLTIEDRPKFPAPPVKEQTQQKANNDDSSPADGNHTPDRRLSPIHPPHVVNILPDHGSRVETSHDGSPRQPLLTPVVVEGYKLEILKSIVYGGLLEAITSLGVISSAAGSGASMLNILVLGLANLFGGLILIIHNLQELREEEPIRTTTTEDHQTNGREEGEGRYKRLLGRRENFTLHASVAILSFIIVGILPPVFYYFSFSEKHNKDYKVLSVFGASLFCIVLLAIAKAHVKSPRGNYLKSILYYATIAVSVSGVSYVAGSFLDQLLERYGWSDGSETHVGQMMLSSLMGRKAGGFGYSSSY